MKSFLFLLIFLSAFSVFASEQYCRTPVLKQSKELLLKTQSVASIQVQSLTMGETFHTYVLKVFSKNTKGKKISELFDAKIDSDCKILKLEAQADSQRLE